MLWALFNDCAQRIITANKGQQRKNLGGILGGLSLPAKTKILDFGCGTGLFAPVCLQQGLTYFGYDIDERLVRYAGLLYKGGLFTDSLIKLREHIPFGVVLANCCFHHIPDVDCADILTKISELLNDEGHFILIDILPVEKDPSFWHRQFMAMEQGQFLRSDQQLKRTLAERFIIVEKRILRSHCFNVSSSANPFYNDLLILICRKRDQ